MGMATITRLWTLEELHSLPDDGNKYELIDGELFVTPAPAPHHEEILARLSSILLPYVSVQRLGRVDHPRSVVRHRDSEVEPDLIVRQSTPARDTAWEDMPTPLLIVEVVSPYTRRRDHMHKRDFYARVGIPEYWIVDGDAREICVVRLGHEDDVRTTEVVWSPPGATQPLQFELRQLLD